MHSGPWVTSTPRAAPSGPGVGAEPASQQHGKLTDKGCWSDKLDGAGVDQAGGCARRAHGGLGGRGLGRTPTKLVPAWELPHEQGLPLGDLLSPLVRRLQNYEIFVLSRLCSSAVSGFTITGSLGISAFNVLTLLWLHFLHVVIFP